ncbi:MAG TPA: FtsW/RodA/SpoVE family cell cycle protein [Planctomycetota bacterium]|nr:FtsW/RodA/SpoVE family cell cycle protein [Planctomycetota bacterium]
MKGAAFTERRSSGFGLGSAVAPQRMPWLRVDWHILALALSLLGLGMLFVAGMAEADLANQRNDISFGGHLRKVAVAFPALVFGLCVRARWLRRNAGLVFGACVLLLLLVPLIGEERNNARRWIPLPGGFFDLQPSELAKFGYVLAMAGLLYARRMKQFGDWVRAGLLTALPMALVMAQPDLGTALTLVPVSIGMVWLAGARAGDLARIALAGVVVAVLAWQLEWIKPYQMQRVDTWLESWEPNQLIAGRNGPAFHAYHARTPIGNGAWFGRGLGNGVANEAAHLPERESDSIFAVVAEEAGFVGTSGILLLYALMIVLLLQSASEVRERFSRLAVGGIALVFASHFVVHVSVNLGLLPLTGLPLPLFSTGGSSLLASFFGLGLALGLAAQSEPTLDGDAFRD